MSEQERQDIDNAIRKRNSALLWQVGLIVLAGAIPIVWSVLHGAASVRDSVMLHEYRINELEKFKDKVEAKYLTQYIKTK